VDDDNEGNWTPVTESDRLSTRTISQASYVEDRVVRKTVPCIDFSGPDILQLREDGSRTVIGHTVLRAGVGGQREENVIY